MGDDTADSAGYGLYLIRMPVSIQPGECTRKGHGAILTTTVRHDFGPDFLPTTFRNLVINDLVDQLTPVVYEMHPLECAGSLRPTSRRHSMPRTISRGVNDRQESDDLICMRSSTKADSDLPRGVADNSPGHEQTPTEQRQSQSQSRLVHRDDVDLRDVHADQRPGLSRAGTEFDNVFIEQNLVMLALNAQQASQTEKPRSTDVRAFLRREIEAAYDIISQIYGEQRRRTRPRSSRASRRRSRRSRCTSGRPRILRPRRRLSRPRQGPPGAAVSGDASRAAVRGPEQLADQPADDPLLRDRRRGRAARPAAPGRHEAGLRQGRRRLRRGRRDAVLPRPARARGRAPVPGVRPAPLAADHLRPLPDGRPAEHRRRQQHDPRPPARPGVRLLLRADQLPAAPPVPAPGRVRRRGARAEPDRHLVLPRRRHVRLPVHAPVSRTRRRSSRTSASSPTC